MFLVWNLFWYFPCCNIDVNIWVLERKNDWLVSEWVSEPCVNLYICSLHWHNQDFLGWKCTWDKCSFSLIGPLQFGFGTRVPELQFHDASSLPVAMGDSWVEQIHNYTEIEDSNPGLSQDSLDAFPWCHADEADAGDLLPHSGDTQMNLDNDVRNGLPSMPSTAAWLPIVCEPPPSASVTSGQSFPRSLAHANRLV